MGTKYINWKKYQRWLGKITDFRLAKVLGISREAVRQQRAKRGIPAKAPRNTRPKGISWDQQPLGKEPDAVLAEALGVSCSSVYRARELRNIPKYVKEGSDE
jgi:hypothetical protein